MDASRNAHFAAQHVQLIAPADKPDSELSRWRWHLLLAVAHRGHFCSRRLLE